MSSFEIRLPLFEGPFDLLLFFIERDELAIKDIPITRITADFLDYIHQLEQLNIEVASEFIVTAATLMRIKAKMLLPRPDVNEQGEEIDPREALVQHLLEYKRFKDVVETMSELENERFQKYERGNSIAEQEYIAQVFQTDYELESLDLYKLLKTFQRVLEKQKDRLNKPKHVVVQYPYTIEDKKLQLQVKLKEASSIDFGELVASCENRIEAIYFFLAILELLQLQIIGAVVDEGYNSLTLVPQPVAITVVEENPLG